MPNGDIVMTYVVAEGYLDTADGIPQFGIEAIVSRDNGQAWDLDHRYILQSYRAKIVSPKYHLAAPQNTYSVVLDDGSILTCFGTGYRATAEKLTTDIAAIKWCPNSKGLNTDSTIADAAEADMILNNKTKISWPLSTIGEGLQLGSKQIDLKDLSTGVNTLKFTFKSRLNGLTTGFAIPIAQLRLYKDASAAKNVLPRGAAW